MKSRKRNRMKGFDYSGNNLYFITTCVKDMVCCFGHVGTGRDLSVQNLSVQNLSVRHLSAHNPSSTMKLNQYGDIVNNQLLWLAEQYPYAVIHNHIVMPNHVHAIIEIDTLLIGRDLSTPPLKIKSVSQLIGAFKTTSSKLIHLAGYTSFEWQRSFHDHIIRDGKSYDNIMNYITTNPERWKGYSKF